MIWTGVGGVGLLEETYPGGRLCSFGDLCLSQFVLISLAVQEVGPHVFTMEGAQSVME